MPRTMETETRRELWRPRSERQAEAEGEPGAAQPGEATQAAPAGPNADRRRRGGDMEEDDPEKANESPRLAEEMGRVVLTFWLLLLRDRGEEEVSRGRSGDDGATVASRSLRMVCTGVVGARARCVPERARPCSAQAGRLAGGGEACWQ